MKRKLNTLELRRLKEGGQQQQQNEEIELSPSKKRSTEKGGGRGQASRTNTVRNLFSGTRTREDPREHQNLNREEIALMFMEVSEKIDRCFDFDIQKWLDRYETLRRGEETNFPEAAMLIMSASQIYGRKVDYLEDIIMHMGQDQKAREDNDDEGKQGTDKPVGRRRAARFQPQSLSDCFSDLEFSCVDRKTVALGSLVAPVERIGVDRRNKFQQMQELCNELRTMPTKQRRQEILNRLRDEANIPPIMSSHTAVRKNQILDLESGETIGTRYDFQIHLNFIDVRSGSLLPEHDLKRFFQRCDVIDYLYEQQEGEREREEPAPPRPVFPLKPREFKMYLPPEYLRDRYRIEMEDTSDFDNELHRAKSSNFRKDPIWKLMNGQSPPPSPGEPVVEIDDTHEEASFANVLSSSTIDQPAELDNTATESEPNTSQETIPEPNSSQESTTSNDPEPSSQPSEINDAPEPELMALENQTPSTVPSDPQKDQQQPTSQSRLSMDSADEGIGADRESLLGKASPPLSRTCSLDKLSECTPEPPLFFGPGTVIAAASSMTPKTTLSLKPALLSLNLLKIPECHLRKHLIFALTAEYKKMKMDLVRKSSPKGKDIFTLQLFSLSHRAPKNPEWVRRPSTPELEDFLGFDEFAEILDGPHGKSLYSLAPPSDGQLSIASRPSSPEVDFFGFQNDDPEPMPSSEASNLNTVDTVAVDKPVVPEAEPAVQPGSQQSTPTRTMSRDSGISDDQNGGDRRRSDSTEHPVETSTQQEEPTTPGPLLAPESALNSEKYLQSVTEAKELIEKVNNWHRKLKPILALSEKRNHFDIHAYGTEIIDSFGPEVAQESPQVINFAQIMEKKQEDFTARYFLSMLMLANTNNVEIATRNQNPNRLTQKEDIELRLLSRKRHHQEMESMGERIPCDNGEGKPGRGKKRKRRQIAEDEAVEPEPVSGVQRLRVEDDNGEDFLANICRMYPEVNDEETMRKRIAFRRGMRRCAYGLSTDERRPEEDNRLAEPATVVPEEKPPPSPPSLPIATEQDPDEVLSVDLLTNEAVIAPCPPPVAMDDDQEPCCSKSLYSTAESGYESMLSGSLL
uniref:Condensin-2 complex subunit H2 C-terminal domain-containing protein n=2 Tax=Culex tarsalis TaxID=7177 RepID=A0A1Q3FGC2_CULTA